MTDATNETVTTAPPILRTAVVLRPIEEAFAVFTEDIGAWWPLPTHSVFAERSGGVQFIDGRLVERGTDGSESTWAEVLEWEPPARLALAWHPGGAAEDANRVEITFESAAAGTLVQVRHDGWEAFGEEALRRRRNYVGPSAWGHVLDHYADVSEVRSDSVDLTAVAAGYDEFFAEAEKGGFGPPPDGEWDAAQVVAHVALNDLAMTAVTHALVFQREPVFENVVCQERSNLDAVIKSCSDWAGLVAFGRACADRSMAAVRRLNADQLAHLVACRLEHDGVVVMEDSRPWGPMATDSQASFHLAAHIGQLRDLRI
jgi:uncharacterized protein YndB with AHSA1/START domain